MRRGSAASARSRHTRMQAAGDPGDHRGLEHDLRAARPRAASTGRAASPARPGTRRAWTMSPSPAMPPTATSTTPPPTVTATAPARARPPPPGAAIHSGTSASGASFTQPAAVSAAVEPSASASATSAAATDVVRPARRRDHHGRKGKHRDGCASAVAADAPHRHAQRARREQAQSRSPPTALRPGCRTHRARERRARPARRPGMPAADRCRRAPARPARGCRRAASPSSSFVAPAIDANATSLTSPPGMESSTSAAAAPATHARRVAARQPLEDELPGARSRRPNATLAQRAAGRRAARTPTITLHSR